MNVIEKYLHEHFASLTEEDMKERPAIDPSQLRDSVPDVFDEPFAKVNTVVNNSPAETAGLRPGDLIRNFGYVNNSNHDGLKKVAECVQGNEDVSIWCSPQGLHSCLSEVREHKAARLTMSHSKTSW